MKAFAKPFAASLLVLSAGYSSVAFAQTAPVAKWKPWLEFGGRSGNDRDIGEFNGYAPLWQDTSHLVLLNLRGMGDDNDNIEGNLGVVYRHMLANGWNLGGYGYVDLRKSELGNDYRQITLGAEALGRDFDFRGNVYLPVGTSHRSTGNGGVTSTTWDTSGPNLQVVETVGGGSSEVALYGVDAEAGVRLPVFKLSSPFEVHLYGGGYYFDNGNATHVTGPRGRLELTAYGLPYLSSQSKMTADITAQHDNVRGGDLFFGLDLSIPLQAIGDKNAPHLSRQEQRMTDSVVRDVDIVTSSASSGGPARTIREDVTDANGDTVGKVVTVDGTGNLATAISTAGINGVVVAQGGNGNVDDGNGGNGVTLLTGQTLLGGGSSLTFKGVTSGNTLTYAAPGSRPTLTGSTGAMDIFTMADNTTLRGVNVDGTGAGGSEVIYASSNTNVTVADVHMSNIPSFLSGVQLNNVTNGTIEDSTFSSTSNATPVGLYNPTNITVRGNTFSGSLDDGIYFAGPGGTATVSNNTFGGTYGQYMTYIAAPVEISGAGNNATGSGGDCEDGGYTYSGDGMSFTNSDTCGARR